MNKYRPFWEAIINNADKEVALLIPRAKQHTYINGIRKIAQAEKSKLPSKYQRYILTFNCRQHELIVSFCKRRVTSYVGLHKPFEI